MGSKDSQRAKREEQVVQSNREELVDRIIHAVREDGIIEPLEGIRLYRYSTPTESIPLVSTPAFAVIAQGSKEVYLADECFRYDPYHYCLGTLELPVVSQVVEASKARPYLGLRMELDPVLVGAVLIESGTETSQPSDTDAKALNVSPLDSTLLDAVVRLVRLLDTPKEARVLMPLITREIIYRLLMGEQSDRLRHIAVHGGHTPPIARAIEQLRKNFDQPLRIDDIAREIGMSISGFHHHFKAVTAMSPLQFQKQMRLQEARRIMLGEGLDAASAGFRVGYNDASHFNREYKKLFGVPPVRNVEKMREAVGLTTSRGVD